MPSSKSKTTKSVKLEIKSMSSKTQSKSVTKTAVVRRKVQTKSVVKKAAAIKLFAPAFDITGRSQGSITLNKESFGQKPNEKLLAQAVRIYFANQFSHKASTKTRSEVRGGGAKPWRQKGTGRARAGSKRSPLWVGGGIVFGPRPRNVQLILPKKMIKKALISALSYQNSLGHIKIVSNFDKLQSKTKLAQNLLDKLNATEKTLIVLENPMQNVKLALRNIPNVWIDLAANLNAYKVLKVQNLLFSKGAIEKFK